MTLAIGAAPWQNINKRTIRAPVNEFDKSTVVSIYPKPLDEKKPTIQPGRFILPPGSYDKPSLLVVGPSSWWRELDDEQPLLEIPVSSIQIADSIVRDYCNGILECNMSTLKPGLFYLPGTKTIEEIKKNHKTELDSARDHQKNWYMALVKMADVLWSRSMGNPLAISDDMRLAAQELNLNKDWMADFTTVEMVRCVACGTLNNSVIMVCPNCKVILKPEEFKKLGLSFAS